MSAAALFHNGAKRTIRAMDDQFVANLRTRNIARLVDSFYAPDARVMPPNSPAVVGREAIIEFFEGMIAGGLEDMSLDTTDVEGSADLVYGVGKYSVVMRPKTGDRITSIGKYVVVYRRLADGQMRAVVDMFSPDSAA